MTKRVSKKKRLTFEDWIDEVGIEFVAKEVGVYHGSVRNWRDKRCDPYVKYLRVLKRLSGLSYEQMIDRDTPTSRIWK